MWFSNKRSADHLSWSEENVCSRKSARSIEAQAEDGQVRNLLPSPAGLTESEETLRRVICQSPPSLSGTVLANGSFGFPITYSEDAGQWVAAGAQHGSHMGGGGEDVDMEGGGDSRRYSCPGMQGSDSFVSLGGIQTNMPAAEVGQAHSWNGNGQSSASSPPPGGDFMVSSSSSASCEETAVEMESEAPPRSWESHRGSTWSTLSALRTAKSGFRDLMDVGGDFGWLK
uniref:Uncharacterized protein n=1 Tax=Chromera velia CCMP2878 TaxID=1169474 RepID=A0A0G4F4P3_9ALVE|eukprot:Cvel_146.t1-p1 / transcript=Cvel_146.t1 / gene=Cvel_146 / organism=Chromera_velia_CCMP2878 / gene_product=hypothetical protein / transcript_product=hypothetical protein / location=Cvel_scaffold10:3855-4535(+) / protein_length=227 / sequence_SO=supercontig / SO=protein_coding / is_pseudo=false